MNPVEYLLAGCLVVMAIGTWVLVNALRNAEDAFENDLGFQLGIAPPVKSLDALPDFASPYPPGAEKPDLVKSKPRRPPSSKPPMLPIGMTLADLDARQTGSPWPVQKPADSNPPATSASQATTPATPTRPPDSPARP